MKNALWTKTELEEQIAAWKKALLLCSTGKSYTIGSRLLTRYDLDAIKDMLTYLSNELSALEQGRGPVRVTARFFRR